jgi:hypothetical protein
LNEGRPLFAFAGVWSKFKGNCGTKSKPIPGPHLDYGVLIMAPNAILGVFAPADPVSSPIDQTWQIWSRNVPTLRNIARHLSSFGTT